MVKAGLYSVQSKVAKVSEKEYLIEHRLLSRRADSDENCRLPACLDRRPEHRFYGAESED
jgi:hypothetical protein